MDMVKAEKERAMLRYRRLRRAAVLSRWLLEAVAALALLSWSSDRLPPAFALCAAVLRRLPAVLFHPASAFLLGNAIIVALFAKSGQQSTEGFPSSPPRSSTSAAEDTREGHRFYSSYFSAAPPPRLHREVDGEVVVYEDKAVCVESTTPATSAAISTACSPKKGGYRKGPSLQRTRSSELPFAVAREGAEEKLLHRSETDVGNSRNAVGKWWPEEEEEEEEEEAEEEEYYEGEGNEEFRRRIEAFIAKQIRFIEREEETLLLAAKAVSSGAVMVAAGVPDHHRP